MLQEKRTTSVSVRDIVKHKIVERGNAGTKNAVAAALVSELNGSCHSRSLSGI